MKKANEVLESISSLEPAAITLKKRVLKKAELIELIREQRSEGRQDLAFNSRPFVLCGLPLKRPKANELSHRRMNGRYVLEVVGHPRYGLPFGRDRLIPIWIATLALRQNSQTVHFRAASELLREFDLPTDGRSYRRLMEGFQRIFASTIFFGTEEQLEKAAVWEMHRFHYFDDLRLWYSRNPAQQSLNGGPFDNVIKLSEPFWQELKLHPIPVDRNVVKALSNSPGTLDFYMWLTWRCWTAKSPSSISLFGPEGLSSQLGFNPKRDRKKREMVRIWLNQVRDFWPECPAELDESGDVLMIQHGKAILPAAHQLL
jgi:Plasmid encoded RepA protein